MTTAADAASRRTQFFGYFSDRLKTAAQTDLPLPDRLVLVTACLDALANHWHATAAADVPAKLSGTNRMHLFLHRHGGHAAFTKVSAPLILNATGKQVGATFPFHRYVPGEMKMNAVADWQDDPELETCPAATDSHELVRWSYGGILYKDFRCAWVHSFVRENEHIRVTEPDNFDRDAPYYRYVINRNRFLMIVPYVFLTATLERAISSFAVESAARNVLPFKE